MRAEDCPQSYDIEPSCFTLDPKRALAHAKMILETSKLPPRNLGIAVAVVIPNQRHPEQILYGLRGPNYHTEYCETWGLPSMGITENDLLETEGDERVFKDILARIGQRKLGGLILKYDLVIGWTGRLRLQKNDPQFKTDYYLIMVDIRSAPIDPDILPERSNAYVDLMWLTPEAHTALVQTTPLRACGACSDLASLASRLGRL